MKKVTQNGFSVVEVLIIVVAVLLLVGAGLFAKSRQDNKSTITNIESSKSQEAGKNKEETEPKIFNLGIKSMDDMNITTNATRDFEKSGHKGFYIFGDILPGTPVRHNPNFEFASVKENTQLISAIDGIVGFIKEQPETGDSEVFLMPKENSEWVIGYDHVSDLQVKKGDKVKVGDVLGYPTRQGNGLLRFEFQINKEDGSKDGIHICPMTLLDSSVKQSWIDQLRETQVKWEEVANIDLYNQTSQDPAGCLYKDMTPVFAQGI